MPDRFEEKLVILRVCPKEAVLSRRGTICKGLDDVTLRKLRAAYAKADEAHLTTMRRREVPPEKLASTMRRTMFGMLGYSEEELRKMDISQFSEEQFREPLAFVLSALSGLPGCSATSDFVVC